MIKHKESGKKVTVSIRLTREQHRLLQRLCSIMHTTQSAYLTGLAEEEAKKELLQYAVRQYVNGAASLSELSAMTGFDVPKLMDAVGETSEKDKRGIETFLNAAKAVAAIHKDPEFYELALKAASG